MALSNIIADLRADLGASDGSAKERTWLVRQINKAAEKLYREHDLVYSLREQFFAFDQDEEEVTLPYYVNTVRAARRPAYDQRNPITMTAMQPRYHYDAWSGVSYKQFREIGYVSTVREITSGGPLLITVPQALTTDVVITITGTTPFSEQTATSVTLTSGQTEVEVPTVFRQISSIRKNTTTATNVSIYTQTDQVLLSMIPNHMLVARFLRLQVGDNSFVRLVSPTENYIIEILYKPVFTPLSEDTDEFQCPNYDLAIVNEVVAQHSRDEKVRLEARRMVEEHLNARTAEFLAGKHTPMNIMPHPAKGVYERCFENPYTRFGNHGSFSVLTP